ARENEQMIAALGDHIEQRFQMLVEPGRATQPAADTDSLVQAVSEQVEQKITPLVQAAQAAASQGEALAHAFADHIDERLKPLLEGPAPSAPAAQDPAPLIKSVAEQFEQRLAATLQANKTASPELTAQVKSLADKLDRLQLPHGDKVALTGIEDR